MKLTDEQINAMAAELLGIECAHPVSEMERDYGDWYCTLCDTNFGDDSTPGFNPCLDANASRRLMVWLMAKSALVYTRTADVFDMNQLKEYLDFSRNRVLTLPPKHITLAVLYAAGKITLEQAREAMEGDGDE